MSESLKQEGSDRVRARASEAMLVSCAHCGRLHAPNSPLAFHPVCAACAAQRRPR
jgi:hypothetical protein